MDGVEAGQSAAHDGDIKGRDIELTRRGRVGSIGHATAPGVIFALREVSDGLARSASTRPFVLASAASTNAELPTVMQCARCSKSTPLREDRWPAKCFRLILFS
jgi:hypothetical protein